MSAIINRRIMKHIREYAKEHNTNVANVTIYTDINDDITYWIKGSKALQDFQHDCADMWDNTTDKIVKEFTSRHINDASRDDTLYYLDVWYENDTNTIICVIEVDKEVWVVDRSEWDHCKIEVDAIRNEAQELFQAISDETWKLHDNFKHIVLAELKTVLNHCHYPPQGLGCVFGCLLNRLWWFLPVWMGGDVTIRKRLAELYVRIVQ